MLNLAANNVIFKGQLTQQIKLLKQRVKGTLFVPTALIVD